MKVKIKTWAELEKKHGIDKYGSILMNIGFIPEMEKDLPKDRIIEVKRAGGFYDWLTTSNDWTISDEMIEKFIK